MDVLSQGRPRMRTSTRNNSGQIIRTGTSFCQAQSVNLEQLEVKSTNYCNGLVCFAQVLVLKALTGLSEESQSQDTSTLRKGD